MDRQSLVPAARTTAAVRWSLLAGLALAVALVGYSLLRYPVLGAAPTTAILYLVMLAIPLAAGGVAAVWGTRPTRLTLELALREGIRFGLAVGAIWMAQILIENLLIFAPPVKATVLAALELAVPVVMLVAGVRSAQQTGQMGPGALTGFWTGLISGLIAFLTILLMTYLFMDLLLTNGLNDADFARNPGVAHPTVLVTEALAAAINHLLLVGIVLGSLLGALGGLIGRGLAATRR